MEDTKSVEQVKLCRQIDQSKIMVILQQPYIREKNPGFIKRKQPLLR